LKALARYREVYGLRHRGLSVEKQQSRKNQSCRQVHNLFHGTSSFLNEEIERNGLGLSQRSFSVKRRGTHARLAGVEIVVDPNFPLTTRRVLSNLV
jgi:hypothetical protein